MKGALGGRGDNKAVRMNRASFDKLRMSGIGCLSYFEEVLDRGPGVVRGVAKKW